MYSSESLKSKLWLPHTVDGLSLCNEEKKLNSWQMSRSRKREWWWIYNICRYLKLTDSFYEFTLTYWVLLTGWPNLLLNFCFCFLFVLINQQKVYMYNSTAVQYNSITSLLDTNHVCNIFIGLKSFELFLTRLLGHLFFAWHYKEVKKNATHQDTKSVIIILNT